MQERLIVQLRQIDAARKKDWAMRTWIRFLANLVRWLQQDPYPSWYYTHEQNADLINRLTWEICTTHVRLDALRRDLNL